MLAKKLLLNAEITHPAASGDMRRGTIQTKDLKRMSQKGIGWWSRSQ